MDAIVNQDCPGCDEHLTVRADEVRVTARDEDDDELTESLCRISAIWSCPTCGHMDGHTWYTDAREMAHAEIVPWVGERSGADTCIMVGPQESLDIDGGQVRTGQEA